MKTYIAGPLCTVAERRLNEDLATELVKLGHQIFLPQRESRSRSSPEEIFECNLSGLDWCDVVIANMDGPDPDSGTSWECGYGFAKGKKVVTFRTDLRTIDDGTNTPFNLMVFQSSSWAKLADTELRSTRMIAAVLDKTLQDAP